MTDRLEGVAWAAAIVLAYGTLYEALVATEVIPFGDVPGEGAPGSSVVFVAAVLGYLVGAAAAVGNTFRPEARRNLAWVVLAPAGAAFLLARWFSFDAYYAPTLRRFSEGAITGEWLIVVVLGAVAAAALAWLSVRVGSLATALALLVEAVTVWILPFGK